MEGDLQASIAGSESGLFSGDPAREVRLINLAFTPDVLQSGELSAEEIQLIAGFAEVFVGYRGVATGTRTGAGNRTKLSRFRADQSLETRLRVTSRIRVGG